ncbi:SPOR domain-containing protein [uncultured Roseovarius sp.]|uniref:SPOR domain-containing protein n=1 Tax=uncultured Roseovarius sp. TaxID=293344 RepID=UPI0026363D81|nr:SPOR domain-containing protein [uncultured Roseovarius sp.]
MRFARQGDHARLCRLMLMGAAFAAMAGCDDNGNFALLPEGSGKQSTTQDGAASGPSVKLVERDVEAPDVFQVTDMGLWDGRPSLGGVWVAHPDVKEPERVIIRSTSDSKFVIGALFRREREVPGPALQVSSDAAAALGMLAGAPAQLNVTALRREEAPEPAAPGAGQAETDEPDDETALAAPADVEATTLDPVAGAAAAAIEKAEAAEAAPAPEPSAKPAAPSSSSLDRPFIQIGIFSVEQNARNTATSMRRAGMVPTVLEQNSQGKAFWRVIVGPASSVSERATLLKKIKGIGFDDAYAVTN